MDEEAIARSTLAGGLATPIARWACVFMLGSWCVASLLRGALALPQTGPLLAVAAGMAGAMLITIQRPRRLTRLESAAVVGLSLCAAVATLASAEEVKSLLLFNTVAHVVLLLIPRGNVVPGIGGWALVMAYGLAWALPHNAGFLATAEFVSIPLAALPGCLLWRYVVVEITRRQLAGRSAMALAEERAARTLEVVAASRSQLRGFRDVAQPVLEEIVGGAPLDEPMRLRLATAEAQIRDRIRVPQLQHPELAERIRELRGLGVTVVLLGEPEPVVIGDDMAVALVDLLRDVTEGRVTVRCLPPGRPVRISAVIAGVSETVQVHLAADGTMITQQ